MEIKPYTTIVTRVAKRLDMPADEVDKIIKDYFAILKDELLHPSSSRIRIPHLGTLFLRTLTLRSMIRRLIKLIREGKHEQITIEKAKDFINRLFKLRHEVYAYSKYRNRITQYKPVEGVVNPFNYQR